MRRISTWILRLPNESFILISFAGLIAFGSLLLLLPVSTRGGQISLIDAVFTATSATCVTGLVVVDTGSYFSPVGQGVILALIQIGGLGIITLSTFFAILMGKRIPMRQREVVRQTHYSLDPRSFFQLVKRIVAFTLGIEALGAALLFLVWRNQFPPLRAAALAAFHSVSAFCNAGFSLFPDSLIRYQTNYAVNFIIMVLILVGGIGFAVIYDVERMLFYRKPLSFHSRVVIRTTGALIAFGTLLFCILEYHNALAGLSFLDKLLVSLFQSVTPRTAGFNTVDFSHLTNSSLILILLLMYVGGSPGSTAGGIKTTSLAILLGMAYSRARGLRSTNMLKRTVPEKSVNEVLAVILISIAILLVFNFTMQWSETGVVPHSKAAGSFMETSFETVSAFGTVGLSTGITGDLSFWGKFQIILLMFIGRVGPLTIAVMIGRQQERILQIEYYKENVMVG